VVVFLAGATTAKGHPPDGTTAIPQSCRNARKPQNPHHHPLLFLASSEMVLITEGKSTE
jgi:hypothetical protein